MKIFKKISMWTLFVALYLNIGWVFGTYMHKNVMYTKPETICAKFLAGGWQFFSSPDMLPENRHDILSNKIFYTFFWPFQIIDAIMLWLIYIVYLLFWLIFVGGIAKLFGLG